jgi:molybdenum transport protein
MEYATGIATRAAAIVDAARAANPDIVVACTRKVFPGTKAMAIKAILAGGAVPHRLGLSDTVLLFPEHLALMDGTAPGAAIATLKRRCPEKKVVIEVTTPEEAERAAEAGADVVQLEKFPVEAVAALAARLAGAPCRIAVAGGVNAANARAYAEAGAHILATSAPYAAPPLDIKAAITPA